MGRYCTADQVAQRYRRVTDVQSYPVTVESSYIYYAESDLDRRLAPYFTVPFSSNNVTAADLSIDLAYAKVIIFDDPDKYKAIMSHVDGVIGDLIDGASAMLTTSGDQLSSSTGNAAWSNTASYHSAFGMGDSSLFQVDSAQLYDEEAQRW